MKHNYAKLNGRIREILGTQGNFARKMGISEHTISCKLHDKTDWKLSEIEQAMELLHIQSEEIKTYFFTRA